MKAGNGYTDCRFLSSGFQVFLDAFGALEGVLVKNLKLFFLTHVVARAAAACRREEGGKSVRALRWIDP